MAGGIGGDGRGYGNQSGPSAGGIGPMAGGAGGDWGAAGSAAATGTVSPAAGGNPGKAVALNGFVVTWLAGNNSTQVKGAIS